MNESTPPVQAGSDVPNIVGAPIGSGSDAPPGLQQIYDALEAKAVDAMRWYESRQRTKKKGAHAVRSLAIALGALTAILPSIIAMLPDKFPLLGVEISAVRLNPIATITGVAAATAILFDRFYGFSSSWGRFIVAYQQIQRNLEDFRIGWRREILKLNSNVPPTDQQILAVYDFLGAFLKSVNDTIQAETQGWLDEFRGALGDIDKAVEAQKAAATATPPMAAAAKGGIDIALADIASLEDHRWTLQLDNRKDEEKIGQSTATITLLDPGIYKLRIAARRDGKPVAAEYAVQVAAAQVSKVAVDKLG